MSKKKTSNLLVSFLIFGLLILTGTISYIIYYSKNIDYIQDTKEKDKEVSASKNQIEEKVDEKKDTPKKDAFSEVLLSFAGDATIGHDSNFAFANSLPYVLDKNNNDFSYFFKNVASIFKEDDISVVNLETNFTTSDTRESKQFNFKADPSYAKSLTLGHIEGVNISNNHIYDYKEQGFNDTIEALKANNINYFGEGNVWTTEVKGAKLGFLGYMGFSDYPELRAKLEKDIKKLKDEGRIVIINFHWGIENDYYPVDSQQTLARFAIDTGADLIIGHHPHVIQGIEQYKGKIIAYSLGNFCFGGNFNPRDKDTFILQVKYKLKNGIPESYAVRAIPTSISSVDYINDYCPTPMEGDNKARLLKKLNNLSKSAGFSISDQFYEISYDGKN
ncbi:CapA family protein [uncultured Clostridium sp.]|uniref:CapA family protein n=1 Tax=uncultured Clostridium sp. TaxID=59620 RepID=UPI0028E79D2B|nr:CapA family protein [uncultured Clostridium sp.]